MTRRKDCNGMSDKGIMVGIDPSRESIQLAITPSQNNGNSKPVLRTLPLVASSFKFFDGLMKKGGSVTVAIENHGAVGEQVALELLSRGIKVFEVNPRVSSDYRRMTTEHKSDHNDAVALLQAMSHIKTLPEVKTTDKAAGLKQLTSMKQMMTRQKTANICRLHALLVQSSIQALLTLLYFIMRYRDE